MPSNYLYWTAIDERNAKLSFQYNNLELFFVVSFKDVGEIEQLQTKRFMDEKKLETWICKLSNYKEINNVFVQTKAESLWKIVKRNFIYAKFYVLKLEYNMQKNSRT